MTRCYKARQGAVPTDAHTRMPQTSRCPNHGQSPPPRRAQIQTHVSTHTRPNRQTATTPPSHPTHTQTHTPTHPDTHTSASSKQTLPTLFSHARRSIPHSPQTVPGTVTHHFLAALVQGELLCLLHHVILLRQTLLPRASVPLLPLPVAPAGPVPTAAVLAAAAVATAALTTALASLAVLAAQV